MTHFTLHPQLAADTVPVTDLALCQILLMDDATYPWLILVPALSDLKELHDLTPGDQQQLMREVTRVSRMLQRLVNADKMNVAALGNMVPQLHIHVIARFEADPAWPGPIWGKMPVAPYDAAARERLIEDITKALG